jgi:hypothetical protein
MESYHTLFIGKLVIGLAHFWSAYMVCVGGIQFIVNYHTFFTRMMMCKVLLMMPLGQMPILVLATKTSSLLDLLEW